MATATTTKIAVNLKLNNGTSTTGTVKTLNVSLGKIDKANIDLAKVMTLAELVGACLTKSVYSVEKVEYATVRS